jgi:hypothetical protein
MDHVPYHTSTYHTAPHRTAPHRTALRWLSKKKKADIWRSAGISVSPADEQEGALLMYIGKALGSECQEERKGEDEEEQRKQRQKERKGGHEA